MTVPVSEAPVNVETVAAALQVHEETIRRWCLSGRIEAQRVGRRWIIPRSEYDRVIGADRAA